MPIESSTPVACLANGLSASLAVAKVMYTSRAWLGGVSLSPTRKSHYELMSSLTTVSEVDTARHTWPCLRNKVRLQTSNSFEKTLANPHHLLHNLLPSPTVALQNFFLRSRSHYTNKLLPSYNGCLTDSNLKPVHLENHTPNI